MADDPKGPRFPPPKVSELLRSVHESLGNDGRDALLDVLRHFDEPEPEGPPPLDAEIGSRIVDASPDALLVVSAEGVIQHANRSATELFGYSQAQFRGMPMDSLLPERFRKAHGSRMKEWFRAPKRRQMGSGMALVGRHASGRDIPLDISLGHMVVDGVTQAIAEIREDFRHRTIVPDGAVAPKLKAKASMPATSGPPSWSPLDPRYFPSGLDENPTIIPDAALRKQLDGEGRRGAEPNIRQRSKPATPQPTPPAESGRSGDTVEATPSTVRRRELAPPDEVSSSAHRFPTDAPDDSAPVPGGRRLTRRYDELSMIGSGGMGEVFRVNDRDLHRNLAVKIIRRELVGNPRAAARFVAEAQVTGQLQHPGIVPVHDIGRLADGRLYFTMREVRGQELGQVIAELHESRTELGWHTTRNGWTFRRVIDAFHKVCVTIAYAHSRGVIHRDIKPENILLGEYNEVLVLDWGLARVVDEDVADLSEAIVTDRARDGGHATVVGAIAGTPAYMPPEQARGEREKQGPWSDVWSLGAVLFEILTGRAPYVGPDAMGVLAQVISNEPDELPESVDVPDALRHVVGRALRRSPTERYPSAAEFSEDVGAWLEGARRREEALALVKQAEERARGIGGMVGRAEALRAEADRHLASLHPGEAVELKKLAWRRYEEAAGLQRGAEVLETVVGQLASAALTQAPDLPEAHAFLADHYHRAHARAEARGAIEAMERYEVLLKAHDNGRHSEYLQGDGAFTLHTNPSGARVEVFRYVERDRRWVLEPFGRVMKTPINAARLPMGRYQLSIQAAGCMPVRYPLFIRRNEHWDGVPPGAAEPYPVHLPTPDDLSDDEVYVPPGWFWSGFDPEARHLPRARVWVDGFIITRDPVTCAEYLEFLNDLARKWRHEEASRWAPTSHPRAFAGAGALTRDRNGVFGLPPDVNGDPIGRDWPVTMIDWQSAGAFCTWRAVRDGFRWALPHELEWEKAARGVDGRVFPFGEHLDPTWCAMGDSHVGRPMHAPVDLYADDVSPYGVRGLAGNVRDWCRDRYLARGPRISSKQRIGLDRATTPASTDPVRRAVRGGSWLSRAEDCMITARNGYLDDERLIDVGFRLVRPFGGVAPA